MSKLNVTQYTPNDGFTLVEILVSLALSSVLLTGFVKVFSENQSTSRLMESLGVQQDNARVAYHVLSRVLRQAGHFGGIEMEEVAVHDSLNITGKGSCNTEWITRTIEPVRGYDGGPSINDVVDLPAGCIDETSYLSGSDILVVRYASPEEMLPISSVDSNTVYIRTIIGGNNLSGAEIFKGSDTPSLGDASDPIGSYNYRYAAHLYFLKSCSIETGSGCINEIPSLVRYQLDGTTWTEHVLVEGVEQFQMEFGVDSDSDYTADTYLTPTAVTNWKQVISVRFSLIVRGSEQDHAMRDTQTYVLAGGVAYTPSSDESAFRRQAYTKVVQLRNMNRG